MVYVEWQHSKSLRLRAKLRAIQQHYSFPPIEFSGDSATDHYEFAEGLVRCSPLRSEGGIHSSTPQKGLDNK